MKTVFLAFLAISSVLSERVSYDGYKVLRTQYLNMTTSKALQVKLKVCFFIFARAQSEHSPSKCSNIFLLGEYGKSEVSEWYQIDPKLVWGAS